MNSNSVGLKLWNLHLFKCSIVTKSISLNRSEGAVMGSRIEVSGFCDLQDPQDCMHAHVCIFVGKESTVKI